jgi:hypothetical protein
MKNIILTIAFLNTMCISAQIGIYNTSPQAVLDVAATNMISPSSEEGVLIPRLTSFPVTDPGLAQNAMLIYMDNIATPLGEGFYYWDAIPKIWIKIGASVWGAGTNTATDPLIYPLSCATTDIVIEDSGFIGFGTNDPNSELHITSDKIKGSPNISPEFIVENTSDDVEVELKPSGIGSLSYLLSASSSIGKGLTIHENNSEEIQLKQGGDFRVDNLETAQNLGIVYPAALYAESDGTVQVKTPYSRLDDLKVNEKNFSSFEMCETITSLEIVHSTSFYSYTTTPTQDVLLEISYHVGATITAFGGGIPDDHDTRHNSKIYGVVLRVNGIDFTTITERMISNEGLNGYFHMSDHIFIPLVADGTTYTITLHGLVQNDVDIIAGIRGEFGGNPDDRIQILEKL